MKRILRLARHGPNSKRRTPRFVGVCEVRELLLPEPEQRPWRGSIWRFMGRHGDEDRLRALPLAILRSLLVLATA